VNYGVATISRLLTIIGLFCRIWSLLYRALLQKRPIMLRSLLIVVTPCLVSTGISYGYRHVLWRISSLGLLRSWEVIFCGRNVIDNVWVMC